MTRLKSWAVLMLLGIGGQSCGDQPRAGAAPETSSPARAPAGRGKLSILVYYDMEGVSGQEDWRTASYAHQDQYRVGRELLIADVNAVVRGLFAGGAQVVRVVDAHGSGNATGPDVPADRLDPRAETVTSDRPIGDVLDLVEPGKYDGVALVAMHAKTGRPGFMAHTFNLGTEVRLNGLWITESEAFGYAWGTVGVPVILVSGDDTLREDLATMPWIEYVEVKRAIDSHRAAARPVDLAHADLEAAAGRAVGRLSTMRPMKLSTPVQVVVRAVPPASLAGLEGLPGVAYSDSGVSFTATDLPKAFAGASVLVGLASELGSVWPAVIGAQPNAALLELQAVDTSVIRAFDYNSGRWVTPVLPARTRRYHGSN